MLNQTLNNLVISEIFFSKETFEYYLEKNKSKYDYSYLDTIINFCNENEIDPEDVKDFISHSLKLKITNEAINNRMLRTNKKPINLNSIF